MASRAIKSRANIKKKHPSTAVIAVAAVVFAFIISLCWGVWSVGSSWLSDLPDYKSADAYNTAQPTVVYANDGQTVLAEFQLENRDPVEINEISDYALKGTVATEDERFYSHGAIDPWGIARALVNNLMGGDLEGASTITQQFVRNTILSSEMDDISIKRKVREAYISIKLEEQYSKDNILLMYLNTINYGSGAYGIEAASERYFSKHASELTIAEAATLVGIPQSPTYNNPEDYPENCTKRRNVVLDRMLTHGTITQEEHDSAVEEELVLDVETRAEDGIYEYPYFTSYVRQQLLDQLSFEEVFNGGLTIYTTIDPTLQGYAEEAAAEVYDDMARTGDSDVSLSMTCIDPNTGYVLVMIGGKDWSDSQFNLATSATGRQAGSSFKAFTLAAAIEQGISPKTVIDCSTGFVNAAWSKPVTNYAGANYGYLSIERMTWVSANTGFARLVTDPDGVTPQSLLDMAARLGVAGDTKYGYGAYPALTLGAAQTNTLRMASAYGAFATGGIRHADTCITQVIAQDGTTLIDNTEVPGEQVLSPEVAGEVTRVLQGVVTQGTGRGSALPSGQVSAGKTGTSQEHRDLWFCGYTPQLSCAVWTGAAQEREMWEAPWCKDAWRIFMSLALDGRERVDFPTAAEPNYDSAFNKKQSVYSEDAAKDTITRLSGASLAEVQAALGSNLTIVETYSSTVAAGSIVKIEFANGTYTAYVSIGPDPNAGGEGDGTGSGKEPPGGGEGPAEPPDDGGQPGGEGSEPAP
mgnify:CR=1 FL=1